jgi:hypothetical protein
MSWWNNSGVFAQPEPPIYELRRQLNIKYYLECIPHHHLYFDDTNPPCHVPALLDVRLSEQGGMSPRSATCSKLDPSLSVRDTVLHFWSILSTVHPLVPAATAHSRTPVRLALYGLPETDPSPAPIRSSTQPTPSRRPDAACAYGPTLRRLRFTIITRSPTTCPGSLPTGKHGHTRLAVTPVLALASHAPPQLGPQGRTLVL